MIPSFHDTDSKISKRNADFYRQNNFNITKDREVFAVELSKSKRLAAIYKKRAKIAPNLDCKHSESKPEALSQKYSLSDISFPSADSIRPKSMCELCQLAIKNVILNECPSTSILDNLKDIFCITQDSIDITNPALLNLRSLISDEDINISVYILKILSEIVKNIYSACLFMIQIDIFGDLMRSFNNLPDLSTSIIELLGNIARFENLSTNSKSKIIDICVRILETRAHDMTNCIYCINTICYNDVASIEKFLDLGWFEICN